MGKEKEIETQKSNWGTGLKAEFNKINWPLKDQLVKETGAVVAVSVVLGLIIALLDFAIQYGIEFLVSF